MNLYFELNPRFSKYYTVDRCLVLSDLDEKAPWVMWQHRGLHITCSADRIWRETSTGVTYVKNRFLVSNAAPVDMAEFMWVKLRAVDVVS